MPTAEQIGRRRACAQGIYDPSPGDSVTPSTGGQARAWAGDAPAKGYASS